MRGMNNNDYINNRPYEVSVWTLQDSFISVLKWSDSEFKGTIQNPKMKLGSDGTQNFSFSIPMSLYIKDKWVDNPVWYNTTNGNLIANMRKIKVIFNKKTEEEEVVEFLITNVKQSHSNGIPMCDIESEGLAFHELGKRGYKIELSADVFYERDSEAFKDGLEIKDEEANPVIVNSLEPTIDYWCGAEECLDLTRADTDEEIKDPRRWYYRVEMDWSSYSDAGHRDPHKIYDEEYVSSWNGDGIAVQVESYREKWHVMDESHSNMYNLTQNIAKAFGVYCRYKYLYDNNYHIIGRLIIFYNNFFYEREGILEFTYPYTTNEVTRNIDSNDIVTKMIVDTIDDDSMTGFLSITNTEANKTQEDYILNFDYLYEVGTITEDQYQYISKYEEKIREANEEIIPYQDRISALNQEQIDVEAKLAIAEAGRIAAEQNRDDTQKEIDSLAASDGTANTTISYSTGITPIPYTEGSQSYYKIELATKGIISNTIKLYKSISGTTPTEPLKGWRVKTKDGQVVGVTHIVIDGVAPAQIYIKYDYDPAKYYTEILNTWTTRINKYKAEKREYSSRLDEIEGLLEGYQTDLKDALANKKALVEDFELMMGPALREGHWTPENYSDFGDKFIKTLSLPTYATGDSLPLLSEEEDKLSSMWDANLFPDEQKNYYLYSVNEIKKYYPCFRLNHNMCEKIYEILNSGEIPSIIYYDYAAADIEDKSYHWRSIPLGGGAELGFVLDTNEKHVRTVIIITEAEEMTDDEISQMKSSAKLGTISLTKPDNADYYTLDMNNLMDISQDVWYNEAVDFSIGDPPRATWVRPRLRFSTLGLQDGGNDVVIKYNDTLLENYTDYSILVREVQIADKRPSYYYITFKPQSLFMGGYPSIQEPVEPSNDEEEEEEATPMEPVSPEANAWTVLQKDINIRYNLSNSSTSVYLDALQVSKENAYPKVSYTLVPTVLNVDVMKYLYKYLNRIIRINDNELKLRDVYGYISELELDLDHPWQDSITIQNYKNKFEDIFSTITAQTESMQRREYTWTETMRAFTPQRQIKQEVLQKSLDTNNITYDFNNTRLSLSNMKGLIGTSDDGSIQVRDNGIFTATEKDENDEWIWQPAILPNGINASLIRAGQLNTEKILIYSGDDVKFQWNSEGLFAYRSILDDPDRAGTAIVNGTNDIDYTQYVVYDSDGLALTNIIDSVPVKLVEIGWDGLILRNKSATAMPAFYADNEGNLNLTGVITAISGKIGGWDITTTGIKGQYIQFVSSPNDPSQSGISLTGEPRNYPQTMMIGNTQYYACTQANDDTVYYSQNSSSHSVGSGGETVYYYKAEDRFVAPIKVRTATVQGTAPASITYDSDGSSTSTSQTVTYTYSYIADKDNSFITDVDGQRILYDGSNDLYSNWYEALKTKFGNTNVRQYVNYTQATVLESEVMSEGTYLTILTYIPTFSVIAETGAVSINNGTIGPFTIAENQFSGGTMASSTLNSCNLTDSYVKINDTDFTLSNIGYLIRDIAVNNANGDISVTRVNGTIVNFKMANTQFFKDQMLAAGKITSLKTSLKDSGTYAGNKAIVEVEAKTGNFTAKGTISLKSFYTKAYNAGYSAGYSAGGGGGGGGGGGDSSTISYAQNNRWTHVVTIDGVSSYESHTTDLSGGVCSKCGYHIP